MMTLLSELTRILSAKAASELRARADGPPLTRAEMLALATLTEIAGGFAGAALPEENLPDADEWEILQNLARADLAVVERAKKSKAA